MALATGSQHMNLLAAASGAAAAADGAQAAAAVIPQTGSTATFVALAATDAAKFAAGSIIALDVDYTGQTGLCRFACCGRICAAGANGCGLHPARHLQCRIGIAGKSRLDLRLPNRCRAALRRRAQSCRQLLDLLTAKAEVSIRSGRRCL